MDFFKINTRSTKTGKVEVFPSFRIVRSTDLMVRGKSFYAIWDQEKGLWSTDEFDVQRLVDKELYEYAENKFHEARVLNMQDFASGTWIKFRDYMRNLSDNAHTLDEHIVFSNDKITKSDYVSKRLPYSLEEGPHESWDLLMSTLYEPSEREKLEWAIGSIVAGEAKDIQKFIVIYGEPAGGKSTILNIIQELFKGYYIMFESKALGSSTNAFATEPFKGNPLVAIEHDGDLSRIDDNTRLNSIVAHEEMTMNEKFKPSYTARSNALLFIGTNKPVMITDAKSGLIRRLIDVTTSGRKLAGHEYQVAMHRVKFELGAIAHYCRDVYNSLGKEKYDGYKPTNMMGRTNVFYNFVENYRYEFQKNDMTNLAQAWEMYKTWCSESNIEHRLARHKFRDELRNYFKTFFERERLDDGTHPRNVYHGFLWDKFDQYTEVKNDPISLVLDSDKSLLDEDLSDCPAQYAIESGAPAHKWVNVHTTLSDIHTDKLHYVILPKNHIVIDFDLKDDTGEKSLLLNLEAASKWPPTYAEFSKSGKGIHLHYKYTGEDVSKLAYLFDKDIEIKRTQIGENGSTSLRRQLSKCNNIPIANISSGLPLKGATKMIDAKAISSEKGLRELILRNLNKEIHPGTKPSIDFIFKILEDAYNSGIKYDLTPLKSSVLIFANNSSNQAEYCVKLVSKMKFKSEDVVEEVHPSVNDDEDLVFYDCEVFSNVFIVCWKYQGSDKPCVRMINPTSTEVEELFRMKLIGFNNRRYDNHILYARVLGYNNEQLFNLSSKLVGNGQNGYFREAYNVSFTDIYDFASAANKKSLKKWQIELGIHHQEFGHPWDQPLPEELWLKAAEYCDNDVISEEVVFNHLSGDWEARKVLAELSGLSVNDTTNQHAIRILFGDNKHPQDQFVYTDLSEMFPGYTFDAGKSTYRGEEVGEGGYVYSEPGIYENVALLDIASMHPASVVALNLFGPYTKRFEELKEARVYIKHDNISSLENLLDGKLKPLVERAKSGSFTFKDLSNGLKTFLNSIYGLTSAGFDNPCRDPRNVDNIVAKRGALFMIDLKYAVQEKGFTVAHVKTDSIKIPNATPEIISFVFEFGKKYGYTFEHEATFEKFCLVNDAVYIAKYKDGKKAGQWSATGAQFAQPFVFKTLFSREPIEFLDLCEVKSVTGNSALYLDMNEELPEGEHNYQFVGRIGLFTPVEKGTGGGLLMRYKDDKYYAATGTKGHRWLEAEVVKDLGISDQIDTAYHEKLVEEAIKDISKFGDFDSFVSEHENKESK